jgi:putative nucleotidyltransferase with HDIG domain
VHSAPQVAHAPTAFDMRAVPAPAPLMPAELPMDPPPPAASVAMHDYLETLNVLVALLEQERGDLRGHSMTVARVTRRVCERLGLQAEDSDTIIAAAYLHDIGKSSAHHLTALNVAQYEAHRQQAKKSYLTPVRIFEAVRLPDKVALILTHLYERVDGQGFPDRLSAKEIPLGSRVLAISETYVDLTGHAGNAFRKKLSPQEAWDVLAKCKGKLFDSNLVDVLKLVVLGDDLRAKLLADRRRALIVDSDAEETTVLELRLAEHGYEVTIARTATDAENELSAEFDIVISEVELRPIDGFALLQKVRAAGNEVPFVFLSHNDDSDTVQRGFELGADDFINKPASPDVVALKVNRVLDGASRKRKSGGVSGSLTEMALPDVVQILFHGRKSGKLAISADGKRGDILFSEGQIFDASFGEFRKEEAFYEMLNLTGGDFELDPNFRTSERKIELGPESLLLEGMRRLDEAGR